MIKPGSNPRPVVLQSFSLCFADSSWQRPECGKGSGNHRFSQRGKDISLPEKAGYPWYLPCLQESLESRLTICIFQEDWFIVSRLLLFKAGKDPLRSSAWKGLFLQGSWGTKWAFLRPWRDTLRPTAMGLQTLQQCHRNSSLKSLHPQIPVRRELLGNKDTQQPAFNSHKVPCGSG
jgi:hypothetical protein